jgi:hypothetical protein
LTIGALAYTWFDFFSEVIWEFSRENAEVRRAFLNDASNNHKTYKAILQRFHEYTQSKKPYREARQRLHSRFLTEKNKTYSGIIKFFAFQSQITPEDSFGLNDQGIARFEKSCSNVTLTFNDRQIELPRILDQSLGFILSGKKFRINDLPGLNNLEEARILVERLLEEGVVCRVNAVESQ